MQLTYILLGLMLAAFASGQLFDRPMFQFGFDFPGFSGPEAFEEENTPFMGLSGIKERMAELSKGQMKKRPGVKTKVKSRHEGKTNITEVEQKGKGFNSWAKLTTYEDGNKTGGQSFTKIFSRLFGDGDNQNQAEGKSKRTECSGQKPCQGENYCDPMEGVCKPRLPLGAACYFKDQCQTVKNALCIWGKCSTGRPGQPGTFCKKDKNCIADSYCGEDAQFSMFHAICKPKLSEGATCGSASPVGVFQVLMGKRSVSEEDEKNPCKDGLKCESVGFLGGRVCVPESLVTKPTNVKGKESEKLEEADKEASSGGQDTDEQEENNEGGDIVPPKGQNPEDQTPVASESSGEEQKPEDDKSEDNKDGEEEETTDEEMEQQNNKKPPVVNPGQLPTNPGQKSPKKPQKLPYPPPAKKGKKKKRHDRKHEESE